MGDTCYFARNGRIYKKNIDENAELEPYEDGYRFVMHFKDGDELTYCPMLTEKGCALGDNKPFDCRVWPFRVNRISEIFSA